MCRAKTDGVFQQNQVSGVDPVLPAGAAGLLILAQHYGLKTGQTVGTGDFNADGGVGFADLLVLAQNYGKMSASPAVTPVPEPGAVMFATLVGAMAVRRRRQA
jgi:hypothetical protein